MLGSRQKNISHLLNSEVFLPASSAGLQPAVQLPQKRPPNSIIKTVCNDCINTQQVASLKQQ